MHWWSVPAQIGDPIVAPPGEYVSNKCMHPRFAVAETVAQQDVWMWIGGKWYIPQQKSHRKDKSVGMETV